MSSKLVTGGILAVIGLITLKVLMFIIGGTLAIVGLLFKLLPLLLIAWLVWRLSARAHARSRRRTSGSDSGTGLAPRAAAAPNAGRVTATRRGMTWNSFG